MDIVSKSRRSEMMAGIRNRNTLPERLIRSELHRLGFRFRLHSKKLPGKPDIVLTKYKTVILVNGCFWHRHRHCKYAYFPKSRISFWKEKFAENIERELNVRRSLKKLGWRVLVVWECQTTRPQVVAQRITKTIHEAKKRRRSIQ